MNLESPLWRRCYLHLRWYFYLKTGPLWLNSPQCLQFEKSLLTRSLERRMFGQVLEIDESQSSAVCIWPPRPSIGANTHSNRRLISGLSGNFRFQPTIQFWRKDEKTKFSPATGVCIKPCDEAKSVQEKRFQPVWLGKCHIGQICNFVQGKFPQGWKGSSNTLCSEQISQNFFCPSFFKINERQKEVCLSLNLKAKLVSSKLYTCVRQSLLSIYYGDHYLHLHIIQHTYMTGVLKGALPDIIITLWTKKNLTTFFPQDWK